MPKSRTRHKGPHKPKPPAPLRPEVAADEEDQPRRRPTQTVGAVVIVGLIVFSMVISVFMPFFVR